MGDKTKASSLLSGKKRFDRWAKTYDRSFLQKWFFGPVHSAMFGMLRRNLPVDPPNCVMDVGCGTGQLLREASLIWPAAQLYGIDPSEQMLTNARRLNPNAIFSLASAESLPFPDSSADVVLSSISFHHWADQEKGLQEITRVLRPGGFLCLADQTFPPTSLFGLKIKNGNQVRALITGIGLVVRQQESLGLRFVIITLAQKL